MEVPKNKKKNLQWHPAFYAGIQIELAEEADNLIFENEHQLGTKPFGIDVLIIKKETDKPLHKNIGKIFRKHNIVEYKSPRDYLSVDDFYKVYAYTCFYKADVKTADSIKIGELTISLVCKNYPQKLIAHLQNERKYKLRKEGKGIYYVIGDKIPIQIIVTGSLSKEENLWLKSLTDNLKEHETIERLVQSYNEHYHDSLYRSMMNVIVRANKEKFKEEDCMCEAMEEILKDRIEAREKKSEIKGEKIGKQIGEKLINDLNKQLAQLGRISDIIRAAEDKEYQDKLIKEFGL